MDVRVVLLLAYTSRNIGALSACVEHMRTVLGMNYPQIYAIAREVNPALELAEWDALLAEADDLWE
jgi:hypothetical protein